MVCGRPNLPLQLGSSIGFCWFLKHVAPAVSHLCSNLMIQSSKFARYLVKKKLITIAFENPVKGSVTSKSYATGQDE